MSENEKFYGIQCLVCGAKLSRAEIKSQDDITVFRLIHENHTAKDATNV